MLSLLLPIILTSYPINPDTFYLTKTRPFISAEAGLIYDTEKNQIIYQKNAKEKLAIASLTKLMTALIIIENHQLNEVVTVGPVIQGIPPSKMNLLINEQLTINDLLKGLLIESANDAAFVLAEYHSGSVQDFVKEMNEKAKKLNLQSTQFENPAGFDNDKNHSNSKDLLKLSLEIINQPAILEISAINKTQTKSISGQTHNLTSTNQLIESIYNIKGLKTGTTIQAGQCLITFSQNKRQLLTIVLASENRFNDSKILIDWANFHL